MKRLQVGDECYVRNGKRDLFKAKVEFVGLNGISVFIPAKGCSQELLRGVSAVANFDSLWNLVAPTPIIKELAK